MDSTNAQQAQRLFVTGLSLITSHGPHGENVMAAEWTMQISYEPMLIAVFIHEGSSTLENIKKTRQFGVNVASEEQATLVSIAGGYSKKEVDKLKVHNSFQIQSNKRHPPLIAGCIVNAECKVSTIKKIGDHTMVVGKVISIRYDKTKKPLVYHSNRYFRIGHMVEPVRDKIIVNKKTFDMFHKASQSKFILKCVGALVRSKNKILILNNRMEQNSIKTIPHIQPKRGKDNMKELENHLENLKLNIVLRDEPKLKRLLIKNKNRIQRINFVLFDGTLKNEHGYLDWKIAKEDSFLKFLIK
ncbi:MAG: flavin reductase family protein [Nitrosotalea sp.]